MTTVLVATIAVSPSLTFYSAARESRRRPTTLAARNSTRITKASMWVKPFSSWLRSEGGSIATGSRGWCFPPLSQKSSCIIKMEGLELDSARRVRKVKESKVVLMVDPVEAKRLSVVEMRAIQACNKLKKQKEIEAINGGWAVLGLMAGIVMDGYTGKSILMQIADYLDALTKLLTRLG